MFVRLLKLPETVRKRYDLSSLRHVIIAAVPCPADVKRAMSNGGGQSSMSFTATESGAVTFATPQDALNKPGTSEKACPTSSCVS
ncbi:hypothetical protein ACFKHW_28985 [Bradyrhizobium lupini]|uniref:hypothetical protein n=1 Tax=Rhizobium lupini TaxID=136996 RepID=UPI00367356E6